MSQKRQGTPGTPQRRQPHKAVHAQPRSARAPVALDRTAAELEADLLRRHREIARLMGSRRHRAKILVAWKDEASNQAPDRTGLRASTELEADLLRRRDEIARLMGSRGHRAKILLSWMDEDGEVTSIARLVGNRLVTVRARVVPTTLDDLRSLRALVDRLKAKLRRQAS